MKLTAILLCLPERYVRSSYFSASAIHLQYEDDGDGGGDGDVMWVDILLLPGTVVRMYKTVQPYFLSLIVNKHLNNTSAQWHIGH